MKHVSLADAKMRFSKLVNDVERGETIEITKRGKAVAHLVPVQRPTQRIDIERLRRHQAQFTSTPLSIEDSLREWKDDERY